MADHVGLKAAPGEHVESRAQVTVVVLFALRLELRPLLRQFDSIRISTATSLPLWRVRAGASELMIVQTGVGRRRTLASLRRLSEIMSPARVLSAGFAGALAPHLEVGDVILATSVIDETTAHPATWQPSFGDSPGIHRGTLLTTDRVVGDPSEKRLMWNHHHAYAVDMESAAAAEWCAERGISFGAVRAITDDARMALSPAVASLIGNDGALVRRSLGTLAMRPLSSARELWRLSRNASIASRRLAEVLGEVLAPVAGRGND